MALIRKEIVQKERTFITSWTMIFIIIITAFLLKIIVNLIEGKMWFVLPIVGASLFAFIWWKSNRSTHSVFKKPVIPVVTSICDNKPTNSDDKPVNSDDKPVNGDDKDDDDDRELNSKVGSNLETVIELTESIASISQSFLVCENESGRPDPDNNTAEVTSPDFQKTQKHPLADQAEEEQPEEERQDNYQDDILVQNAKTKTVLSFVKKSGNDSSITGKVYKGLWDSEVDDSDEELETVKHSLSGKVYKSLWDSDDENEESSQ